ncbi:helix-turn-helix domain-containing protein [Pseudobacillus sp. 179-B 2D1 NHS]|uniref:helix-turn-helix domain-containing protein n=1 Tax=Pseudobacillus sp. 179-B 2D1 NHS TaxID=3374292 RepID=UPI00387A659F
MTNEELKFLIRKKNEIKQFRTLYDISQELLANELGISQPHLSRMERNVSPVTNEIRSRIKELEEKLGG